MKIEQNILECSISKEFWWQCIKNTDIYLISVMYIVRVINLL